MVPAEVPKVSLQVVQPYNTALHDREIPWKQTRQLKSPTYSHRLLQQTRTDKQASEWQPVFARDLSLSAAPDSPIQPRQLLSTSTLGFQ